MNLSLEPWPRLINNDLLADFSFQLQCPGYWTATRQVLEKEQSKILQKILEILYPHHSSSGTARSKLEMNVLQLFASDLSC